MVEIETIKYRLEQTNGKLITFIYLKFLLIYLRGRDTEKGECVFSPTNPLPKHL